MRAKGKVDKQKGIEGVYRIPFVPIWCSLKNYSQKLRIVNSFRRGDIILFNNIVNGENVGTISV